MQLNIPLLTLGWWVLITFVLVLVVFERILKLKHDEWTGQSERVDLIVFFLDSIGLFRILSLCLSFGVGYLMLKKVSVLHQFCLLGRIEPVLFRGFLLFLYMDFLSYCYHRFSHWSETVWQIHMMHHSAKSLRLFTFMRRHPIESEIKIILTAIPTALVGADIHTFFLVALIQRIYGVFVHSSWEVHYPKPLSYLLVTPAFHRFHHRVSEMPPGNYGAMLSIWDRLFGTYVEPPKNRDYKIGLVESFNSENFFNLTFLFQKYFFKKLFRR